MTAFDAAADTLFNDPNLAVAAIYKVGGAGAGFPVQVIRVQPDDALTSLAGLEIVSSTNLFDVRQSDVANPAAADTLAIGTAVFTVQSAPKFNALRKTWRLDCHD